MKAIIRTAILLVIQVLWSTPTWAQNPQNLYRLSEGVSRSHVEYHTFKIPKATETTLADLKGPGKITHWYITDNTGGKWYPGLVLKVFWDDESQPSLLVPLSDFFGAVGGKTLDYESAAMEINHLSYMCWLPMPFAQRARFILANDGDRDYDQVIAYGIDYEQGEEFEKETSRLHCAWCRSNPTENGLHTILEARGRGHYVGNFLQVHSTYNGWWGEGDTILELDGEAITHTPGTEDEYGSCWGFGGLYSHARLGHIQDEKGNNRMYRWYLENPVRFGKSLKVSIQNQRYDKGQIPSADDYTSVAFWYQAEPHQPIRLQSFADRTTPTRAVKYGK